MGLNVEFEHRWSRQVGKQNCGAWTDGFIDNLEDMWGLRRYLKNRSGRMCGRLVGRGNYLDLSDGRLLPFASFAFINKPKTGRTLGSASRGTRNQKKGVLFSAYALGTEERDGMSEFHECGRKGV